jgi:hypothetical protein
VIHLEKHLGKLKEMQRETDLEMQRETPKERPMERRRGIQMAMEKH